MIVDERVSQSAWTFLRMACLHRKLKVMILTRGFVNQMVQKAVAFCAIILAEQRKQKKAGVRLSINENCKLSLVCSCLRALTYNSQQAVAALRSRSGITKELKDINTAVKLIHNQVRIGDVKHADAEITQSAARDMEYICQILM